MSITLRAYPTAFLISPDEAKKENIRKKIDNKKEKQINKDVALKNLQYIRVLTNLGFREFKELMLAFISNSYGDDTTYTLVNSLKIHCDVEKNNCILTMSGTPNSKLLQQYSEEFFQSLDSYANRNVRLINTSEYFYYNYKTKFNDIKEIYKNIKEQGGKGICSVSDNEIIAKVDGQNIRYHRKNEDENFTLEVEQKVLILNIGMPQDVQGVNVAYPVLKELKIKTNITREELRTLLKKAGYGFYEGNSQTPLRYSNATLNWVYDKGHYTAEFSGLNNNDMHREAEILFRQMNVAAGRDLRMIDKKSTVIYTYNTNYKDKGVLLNTLIEHGAINLTEKNDDITCTLFDMEMKYKKDSKTGAYVLDITQVKNQEDCCDLIDELNDEYGLNIQEMI